MSKEVPFLVVPKRNRPAVFPERLPEQLAPLEIYDPQRLQNADFVTLIQRLDDLSFGPRGLHMPGWVFYDCGVMPGIVFGFGRPRDQMRPWILRVLGVPDDYDGLVPLTLFIAIAMLPPRSWLVYTLTSLNEVAPGATSERLIRDTLASGLGLLNVETLYGTIQWRSRSLPHYTAIGPLDVISAWTPAHDIPSTLTFQVKIPPTGTSRLLHSSHVITSDAPAPNALVNVDDPTDLQNLQRSVEQGQRIQVVAPPQTVGRYTLGMVHTGDLSQ